MTASEFNFPFETNAIVEVTNLDVSVPGCPPHSCVHYHWVDWPDRGVPQADLAPLYLLHEFVNKKSPIIIHCSAGIGRTGSMVLIQYAMEVLERGEPLRPMNIYLEQNEQQYLYVHQVLLNYLQKTGTLPQSLDPALESFKKAYHKLTRGF
ncbi:Protein-tyrosine phosphatase [Teladorsagia circumcincta]|uniref:Protein-tyrosine phosphatase n=1 Tax=Teladorsagia circumcincta TaxID=45464 RepID=A0A2G9USX5_TELCI|nr:Protein-tyrosine phosphatase [Teladorsagia circumcincta]